MKNPSSSIHPPLTDRPYGEVQKVSPARPRTDRPFHTEVIEMSPQPLPRSSATRSTALLVLPFVALLLAAGCATGTNDQPGTDTAAQETVTRTVTAEQNTTTDQEKPDDDNAADPAASGFDRNNCSTELSGQDVAGDVQVRGGQTCVLSGLTVNGDVDVDHGGRLVARDVRVTEDIEAEGHAGVLVSGGEVLGSVEIEEGGEATIKNVRIHGDLECEDNNPAPTGGGNQVSGEREGQCSGL